ncbi:Uncharacterised protein [Vibrio cholerae]|uniref:Uncharacterized protein n=1 Tax=Vibrio cholerae TaxID=666 RepID=A0A655X1J8_VIBCL|nr:Uncharacterised protein [Vibrio cholerae]
MIKIDRLMVWVKFAFHNPIGNTAWHFVRTTSQHINNAHAFTTLIPTAFHLMRRYRTTPQKIVRKNRLSHR